MEIGPQNPTPSGFGDLLRAPRSYFPMMSGTRRLKGSASLRAEVVAKSSYCRAWIVTIYIYIYIYFFLNIYRRMWLHIYIYGCRYIDT